MESNLTQVDTKKERQLQWMCVYINPSQGECHYLQILLHHVPGVTSYTDLTKTPDGVTHRTFKEAAFALGLLESDEEWDQYLAEVSVSFMPKQLRTLFLTILIFGEPAKPTMLWEKYKEHMGEDVIQQIPVHLQVSDEECRNKVDNEVLLLLQEELEGMGLCLERFGLPTPDMQNRLQRILRVIAEEMFDTENQKEISNSKYVQLNEDQHKAFCAIMQADDETHPKQFFLNALSGYGKTFLIESLLFTVRSLAKIALAVASSGIAAVLLEGGRTTDSHFKIPIPINESSVCSISLQSDDAKLLQQTSLIIWDEIMMSHVDQIDCVDRSLRDILKVDKPFGGIVVVFQGDPQQILPVFHHGNRAQIVKACIHSSSLWNQIQQISLTVNMWVNPEQVDFANYLLALGNGAVPLHPEVGEDMIQVPKQFLVDTIDELIEKVLPGIGDGYADKYFVACCAILTPINDNVDKINESIMEKFPGKGKTYLSAHTIVEEDLHNAYPSDFLNSITLSGMPPHSMTL